MGFSHAWAFLYHHIGGSNCDVPQPPSPHPRPICFIFMQFSPNILPSNRFLSQTHKWLPHLLEILDPPLHQHQHLQTDRFDSAFFLRSFIHSLAIHVLFVLWWTSQCVAMALTDITKIQRGRYDHAIWWQFQIKEAPLLLNVLVTCQRILSFLTWISR